ncbi:Transcription initiation factor TFIID subunit 12 [Thoreauomyces humboldtii]|nr:Transcription initiation factor TFIID subunit 12 [Thoreauomyces humboldtii]
MNAAAATGVAAATPTPTAPGTTTTATGSPASWGVTPTAAQPSSQNNSPQPQSPRPQSPRPPLSRAQSGSSSPLVTGAAPVAGHVPPGQPQQPPFPGAGAAAALNMQNLTSMQTPGHPQYQQYLQALHYYQNLMARPGQPGQPPPTASQSSSATATPNATPPGTPQPSKAVPPMSQPQSAAPRPMSYASRPTPRPGQPRPPPPGVRQHFPQQLNTQFNPSARNLPSNYTASPTSIHPGTNPAAFAQGANLRPPIPRYDPRDPRDPATMPVLTKERLRNLVSQIDSSQRLEADVEEMLLEVADEFLNSITEKACKLSRHRDSLRVGVSDARIPLVEQDWGIRIPGFGGGEERSAAAGNGDDATAEVKDEDMTDTEKTRAHLERSQRVREAIRDAGRHKYGTASAPGNPVGGVRKHTAKTRGAGKRRGG